MERFLRARRELAGFERLTQATEFRFANAARLKRACLVRFGASVHQIELMLMDEFIEGLRKDAPEDTPEEAEEAEAYRKLKAEVEKDVEAVRRE